jgi:hydrogenase maturation protein HypF
VQGVGFRPFVYRLALRHGLGGWVKNTTRDVQIAVEGAPGALEAFLGELRAEAPPLARIMGVTLESSGPEGRYGFDILPSDARSTGEIPIPPDAGLCPSCFAELFDPGNRRYRYPFLTCSDCGPRYTVIEGMPYDRERTSMRVFQQCPECLAEYHDPASRRYHCESNSCPRCGPRLWFEALPRIETAGPEAAVAAAVECLAAGKILALRGLGGFHLAVDAAEEAAVTRLRERKRRESKPLAVMVPSLSEAGQLAELDPAEAELLASPGRPILLASRRDGARLAPSIAPGLSRIGLLLAYTPLHHLVLEAFGRPLVMTSANQSDEPIAVGNDEARRRLDGIADGFLFHDREIVNRYDDSVFRVVSGKPVLLRRARGYAPAPIPLPIATPVPVLAVGPLLKNTFTLAAGSTAWVSQHIGDLETIETLDHFEHSLERCRRLFHVDPEIAVRDRHPEYLSSRIAGELGLKRVMQVQHHHAHIAAVLAEHGEAGPVIGLALDGAGYGEDGTTWGAEVLIADLQAYRRAGHLLPAPLPGGDRGARSPWRAAVGYLSLEPRLLEDVLGMFSAVPPGELALVRRQVDQNLNAPLASSMGRLFDAVAALLGVRLEAAFEGQAAMELEALAGRCPAGEYPARFEKREGRVVLDPLPILVELAWAKKRGAAVADLAADFHASIASALTELVRRVASTSALRTVALGGGVFQNGRLLASMVRRLERDGFRVLVPRQLPPNDGAISYGQAAVAAAMLSAEGLARSGQREVTPLSLEPLLADPFSLHPQGC